MEQPTPAELAQRRVSIARANKYWREVPDDFVRRPLGLLVSASTDEVFRVYAGATFVGGRLEFAQNSKLSYVIRNGDVLVLEPLGTWSEIVKKRTQAGIR